MTVPVEVRPPAPIAAAAPPERPTRRLSPTNWALLGLLLTAGALYLWNLSASGWANAFYSAAAQAGADNWTSFLFGSSDMANSITVDKPPAAIWVMALSVKVFGLNSWSLLVPQALMGVGSVWLLFATVRRWYGDAAGLFAGAVLALMPAATLMFRFNNPDALLVLLLVGAAYCMVRGIESARTRWLAVVGALIGFAFLTKSMQAFLVLPGFVLAYAVAAPTSWAKRLRDLVVALVAVVVAGGWWVALVEVWPADSRPYIGGSQTNSVLDLILGYNGLGRITGDEAGSVVPGGGVTGGAGGGAGGMWGETGIGRLFDGSWAGAIAWLLPAAVVMLAIGFFLTRGEARTGRRRAGLIIWGGWLLVTWLTFSFAGGIIHEYYAVALAPAIGAVVAAVATMLWARRAEAASRYLLAGLTAAAVLYAAWLLTRAGGWYATAGAALATAGVLVGLGIALLPQFRPASRWIALAAVASVLVGPLLFSVQTAATPHEGSLPTAGPALTGSRSGPGGGPAPGGGPGANGATPPAGLTPGAGGVPAGGPGGGGLLNASAPSAELVDVLTAHAGDYTWIAAAVGSQNGAGYQLATGYSVMPIGGFNGSDPSPTLAQFKEYVAQGKIHYFIAGGMGGPGGMGGSSGSSAIGNWVQENFTSTTVGNVTLYDLTESA